MRRALQAAVVTVLAVLAVPTLVAVNETGAAAASSYRAPVAGFTVGDPGIIYDGSRWISLYTGYRGNVAIAKHANGPWKRLNRPALNADPAWAQQSTGGHRPSYWAPSAIKIGTSDYMIVFAAVRKDAKSKRCIGVGFASKATGPYTPASHPLSCVGGKFGAADVMKKVNTKNSVIDATPRILVVNGAPGLYVTYKTQRTVNGHYSSTIRMVQVNAGSNPSNVQIVGKSRQLTARPTNIEENPVMVQTGGTFTLFTSLGGYTLCGYHTEYRTSTNPWKWSDASTPLAFPAGTKTCGHGDADIYPSPTDKTWRIFWSGRYPAQGHPFHLYVGVLKFKGNVPKVTKIYNRRKS